MIQLEVFMLDYHYQIKLDNDRELECFTNWYLSDVPCKSGYKPKVFWDGDHVIVEHIDKSTGKTYKVRMTRELFNIELDRWPYFGLIGKPVSKDEAFTIISEYYPFKRRKVSSEITFNITEEVNYVNQYVDTDAWCMFKEDEKSWIRPDGRIGLFDSSYIKIPDFYELVLYFENMAKIDGIDVYIGITSISSAPCMACPYCRYVMNKYTKRKDRSEDIDFPEDSMTNEEMLNKLHDGGWLDDEWGYFFSCNGA